EDERTTSERCQDSIDASIKCLTASAQRQRIEIALHRLELLDAVAGNREIDGPIETDCIDCHAVDVAEHVASRSTRKANDLRAWHSFPQFAHDLSCRLNAPPLELIWRQDTSPGVENLHCIDAGFELPRKIVDRCFDQHIDQMGESIR